MSIQKKFRAFLIVVILCLIVAVIMREVAGFEEGASVAFEGLTVAFTGILLCLGVHLQGYEEGLREHDKEKSTKK